MRSETKTKVLALLVAPPLVKNMSSVVEDQQEPRDGPPDNGIIHVRVDLVVEETDRSDVEGGAPLPRSLLVEAPRPCRTGKVRDEGHVVDILPTEGNVRDDVVQGVGPILRRPRTFEGPSGGLEGNPRLPVRRPDEVSAEPEVDGGQDHTGNGTRRYQNVPTGVPPPVTQPLYRSPPGPRTSLPPSGRPRGGPPLRCVLEVSTST